MVDELFADLGPVSETYSATVDDVRTDVPGPERTVNVYRHGTDVVDSLQMTWSGQITGSRPAGTTPTWDCPYAGHGRASDKRRQPRQSVRRER